MTHADPRGDGTVPAMTHADPRGDGTVVGIDLGTTNSVVATVTDQGLEVIRDRNGKSLVPSVVAFVPNGEILVGRRARERAVIDPLNTIHSAKRIIGRPCNAPDTQRIISGCPTPSPRATTKSPSSTAGGGISHPSTSRRGSWDIFAPGPNTARVAQPPRAS